MTSLLGLDPGTHLFGFGVGKATTGGVEYVRHGVMEHDLETEEEMCSYIYRYTMHLIKEHNPIACGIERLFLPKFQNKSFIFIAQARGAALTALKNYKVPVYHLMPTEIKAAVAGKKTASKPEVQRAVKEVLGLPFIPKPDDAADGLAAMITLRGKLG